MIESQLKMPVIFFYETHSVFPLQSSFTDFVCISNHHRP